MRDRLLPLSALVVAGALALAGCTSTAAAPAGDRLAVVASTDVYGGLVQQVGGDEVDVTSIVSGGANDPHEYEASPSDQLAVRDAALIVRNGGGYDSFVEGLIEASGSTAPVVVAVESSHDWPGASDAHASPEPSGAAEPHDEHEHEHDGHDHSGHGHVEGFNEHVWYDPHTVSHVVEAIRDQLIALRPAATEAFTANAAKLSAEIEGVESVVEGIHAAHEGATVMATEPVAHYLLSEAGLVDATPEALSQAVEEGQDVPPATLIEALDRVADGTVRVLVANAQTGGAETDQLISAARAKGIPVLEFTETVPSGQTYVQWMTQNAQQLEGALAG